MFQINSPYIDFARVVVCRKNNVVKDCGGKAYGGRKRHRASAESIVVS